LNSWVKTYLKQLEPSKNSNRPAKTAKKSKPADFLKSINCYGKVYGVLTRFFSCEDPTLTFTFVCNRTQDFDFALLKLVTSVPVSATANYACLPPGQNYKLKVL
jgi:hypothetical protein